MFFSSSDRLSKEANTEAKLPDVASEGSSILCICLNRCSSGTNDARLHHQSEQGRWCRGLPYVHSTRLKAAYTFCGSGGVQTLWSNKTCTSVRIIQPEPYAS